MWPILAFLFGVAAGFDNGSLFAGIDLTGTPFAFEDSEANRSIFARSLNAGKFTGIANRWTVSEHMEGARYSSKDVIISDGGKKIFLNFDYWDNSVMSELTEVDDKLGLCGDNSDRPSAWFENGYDLSGLRITLEGGGDYNKTIETTEASIEASSNHFYGDDNVYETKDNFPVSIGLSGVNSLSIKTGESVEISKLFSGLTDKHSLTWKTSIDTSTPGKKEGVVTVEYRGELTAVVDIPVSVTVEEPPKEDFKSDKTSETKEDLKAEKIQAPNTGFENRGFFAMVLAGISTTTILTAIFFKKK